jgi:hypothetical protein
LKTIFTEDATERSEIVKVFNDTQHNYELETRSYTNESSGKTRKRSHSASTESTDSVSSLENKHVSKKKKGGKKNKTQRRNIKI